MQGDFELIFNQFVNSFMFLVAGTRGGILSLSSKSQVDVFRVSLCSLAESAVEVFSGVASLRTRLLDGSQKIACVNQIKAV